MAAISYFAKTVEDAETVTYRYGHEEELEHSFVIDKASERPVMDPDEATIFTRVALKGILRSFHEYGRWPERGAGVT